MLKFYSSSNNTLKIVNLLAILSGLTFFSSCVYRQPDDPQYIKPYQQQSVPVQRPRGDGYYYSPQQQYQGYSNAPPASRYYNNPYAMPPQNAYPYYDGDQYYRPPSAYGATDDVPASTDRY